MNHHVVALAKIIDLAINEMCMQIEPWMFLTCALFLGELLFQDQRTIEAEEAVKVGQ